jgi:hypothetical protein
MINEMPETMTEAMQVGQQWGRQRGQRMFGELQKQGKVGYGRALLGYRDGPGPAIGRYRISPGNSPFAASGPFW